MEGKQASKHYGISFANWYDLRWQAQRNILSFFPPVTKLQKSMKAVISLFHLTLKFDQIMTRNKKCYQSNVLFCIFCILHPGTGAQGQPRQ